MCSSDLDVRYAINGVELYGGPSHSNLLGEVVEDAADSQLGSSNDSQALAQLLGNILNADRGAVSISGAIDPASLVIRARTLSNGLLVSGETTTDLDFYEFDLIRDSVEHNYANFVSMVFDVDLADGIGRGDTSLWVFAQVITRTGATETHLVLTGHDSNVADDRPGPLEGADLDNLRRGSIGSLAPFIWPVDRKSVVEG